MKTTSFLHPVDIVKLASIFKVPFRKRCSQKDIDVIKSSVEYSIPKEETKRKKYIERRAQIGRGDIEGMQEIEVGERTV